MFVKFEQRAGKKYRTLRRIHFEVAAFIFHGDETAEEVFMSGMGKLFLSNSPYYLCLIQR